MLLRREKGQSTVEYAIIVAVVISALLAMQFWMRRGVMGKLRDSSDSIGDQFNPFEATSNVTRTFDSTRIEDSQATGETTTTFQGESQSEVGERQEAGELDSSQLFQ